MNASISQLSTDTGRSSIVQLLERYRQDIRTEKLNLTVGIYTDETGHCPILESVRQAERYLVEHQTSKASFNLIGADSFHRAVRAILFPSMSTNVDDPRIQVIQTLGASGALHLVGQLLERHTASARIWLCSPTWENHSALLGGHRTEFGFYRYQAESHERLCLEAIIEDLQAAKPGDIVLLHVCCHNPTGIDPNIGQWEALACFFAEKKLIPLFDFAYQGFAYSIQRDAAPLALFMEQLDTMFICNSFSKNMGVYDERIGALTLFCRDSIQLTAWSEAIKILIRSSYSMPPLHGSSIVSHIINDPDNFARWQYEVSDMRSDLQKRRAALFSVLTEVGIIDDILSYKQQQGMFICLNLSLSNIELLRIDHGIYLLDSGRVCIAGLGMNDIQRFCNALKDVTCKTIGKSA